MDLDSDYYSSRCKDHKWFFACLKGLLWRFRMGIVIIKHYSILK
jgi:hypothetical protein